MVPGGTQPPSAHPGIPLDSRRFVADTEELLLAGYGVPAYIRRARNLELAEQELDARVQRLWFDRVRPVARQVRSLLALVSDDRALWELLDHGRRYPAFREVEALVSRHPDYARFGADRSLFGPTRAARVRELCRLIREFNDTWAAAVEGIDLGPVNGLIAEYNRWFPLERECAMRHAFQFRDDFQPRPRIEPAELAIRQPLLPELD